MIEKILFVFIGGGLGSSARYITNITIAKHIPENIYLSTLLVNILGCFLFGLFTALSIKTNTLNSHYTTALTTGFCGGFTTFSAFAFENLNMISAEQILLSSSYIALSVVFGFTACYLGLKII